MMPISPSIKKNLEHLENIYTALRKNNIMLSKSEAMKIVGGRYVLERLVTAGKIRHTEQGKAGRKWYCAAEDVFRYAKG